MKEIILAISFALAPCVLVKPVYAMDPGTIVIASSVAQNLVSLFGPQGADPGLEISKANNELLKGLHGRLNSVEDGILSLLIQFSELPAVTTHSALTAQEMLLNDKIVAVGSNYLNIDVAGFEKDLKIVESSGTEHQQLVDDFVSQVRSRLKIIEHDRATLMKRPSINGLSIVTAAWIEITMHADIDNYPGDMIAVSDIYKKYFKEILDNKNPKSLVSLIKNVQEKLDQKKLVLRKLGGIGSKRTLEGNYFQGCTISQRLQHTERMCFRQLKNDNPDIIIREPYDCSWDTWVDDQSIQISVNVTSRPIEKQWAKHLIYEVNLTESPHELTASCPKNQDKFVTFRNEGNVKLQAIRSTIDVINSLTKLIVNLKVIEQSVVKAQLWLSTINGNNPGFFNKGVLRKNIQYLLNLENQINPQKSLLVSGAFERYELPETVIKDVQSYREYIRQLIVIQDARIEEAFNKEAQRAKAQRVMSLIGLAAHSYLLAHQIDKDLTLENVKKTSEELVNLKPGSGSADKSAINNPSENSEEMEEDKGELRKSTMDAPSLKSKISEEEAKIMKVLEILKELRDNPISWDKQVDAMSPLSERELKIYQGLELINGVSDTAADKLSEKGKGNISDYIDIAKDISNGKILKAKIKALKKAFSPSVLGDGTLFGRSSRNAMRKELNARAQEAMNYRFGNQLFKSNVIIDPDKVETNEQGEWRNHRPIIKP